jgi:hypothetical protein
LQLLNGGSLIFTSTIKANNMKLIAKTGFSQGLNNPLGLPNGSQHVERGAIFSIGEDLPFEQLSKEQQALYGTISHCSCLLDSEEGKRIFEESERTRKIEMQRKRAASPKTDWGRLGALIALAALILAALTYFWPR